MPEMLEQSLKKMIFLVCISTALWGNVLSQSLLYYTARTNFPGARAAGFADAFVSDAHDVSSMYWNPGALAYLKQSSVILNYSQEQVIRGMEEDITFPFRVSEGEALTGGISVNNVGYFGTRSETAFRAVQYTATVAYAREILPSFSVGASAALQYGKTDVSKLWSRSSSIGILYVPDDQLSYGASFSGIGSGMLYTSDRSTTTLTTQNLPRILSAGASVRFPGGPDRPVFILSASNQKLFGESGIRYNGGIEIWPFKVLALRGGYLVYPHLSAARFGMGLHLAAIELDSSISPSKLTDQAVHFSLAIDL